MNKISEIESLNSENPKLRNYVSLISAEIELIQRVGEIKENFSNPDDSEHLIRSILNRISIIKSERLALQKELSLD